MQEKIIEELRQELKEQIKENQELEKKIDGLVTIIDLVKEYVEKNKEKLYQGRNDFTCEIRYSDEVVKAKDLLEILERVNEK